MSLTVRLVLVVMIPVILVAGVYGYVRSRREQAELLTDQQEEMARSGRAVRIAAENAIRGRQLADVLLVLTEMVEAQEGIDRIRLFDLELRPTLASGQIPVEDDIPVDALRRAIAAGQPETLIDEGHGRHLIYYVTPFHDQNHRIIGALELVQVATRVDARIRAANWDIFDRLAMLVIGIAVLVSVMLQRQVLRPLRHLMMGIQRLGRGEPGAPIPIERRDELGRVGEAFNEMAARLGRARRDLEAETERALDLERQLRHAETLSVAGKLASGIAHEIGTPLNIISGRAEFLLKMSPAGSQERRELESIVGQIERITTTIHAMLDTVRFQHPELSPTVLSDAVAAFLPLLRHAARRRAVMLNTDIPDALPLVLADSNQLQQVLINLVLNALDATSEGGEVVVSAVTCERNGRSGVAVTVKDTGSGIAPELLRKVFEPFFTTKGKGEGTGLGLSICRDIVRAHDGTLEVASSVGVGSSFTFWLPAVEDDQR